MNGGIALVCDTAGTIQECLHNQLLAEAPRPGSLFVSLAAHGSEPRALNFVRHLVDHNAAVGWQFEIREGHMVCFAGGRLGDSLLIVGTSTDRLHDELLLMPNKQVHAGEPLLEEFLESTTTSPRRNESWRHETRKWKGW